MAKGGADSVTGAGSAVLDRARLELLEREGELAAIEGRIASACDGNGSLVLVEGPAGIGKTRLLEAARNRAYGRGMQVLGARASELEQDFPFGIVRQVVDTALAGLNADTRAAMLSGAAEPAQAILDGHDVAVRLPRSEAVFSILHGIYWLCVNLSAEGPLAIVVDDAHWADTSSLRWLHFLASRLEGLPITVVVASRSGEPSSHRLLDGLEHQPGVLVVRPQELSQEAVAQVVRWELSPAADDELCAACHETSKGNPFLVTELLAALAEGDERTPEHVLALGSASVSRSVLARVGRLPPEAAALTKALAVLGGETELSLAARLAGVSYGPATVAVDALARSQILARGSTLSFVHPLVRASIYEDLSRLGRAHAHARAAELLAERGARTETVALHLLAADPSGDPWAVEWLRRAGTRAMASGAPEAAVTYLRRALAEPPEEQDRCAILLELGGAEAESFAPEAEERLAAALDAARTPEERGAVALELGRALLHRERAEGAIEAFDRGIAAIEGVDRELALRLEAEALIAASMSLELGPGAIARAKRVVTGVEGATPAERMVLGGCAWTFGLSASAPAPEVIDMAERALAGGDLLALEGPESPAFLGAANALSISDHTTAAEAHLTDALGEAQRMQSIGAFAIASSWRAWALYRRGALVEAEEDARSAVGVAVEQGYGLAVPVALAVLVECMVERGRSDEAAAELERHWEEAELSRSALYTPTLAARGRLRAVTGSLDGALEDLRACARLHTASGIRNPGAGDWRPIAARILAATGATDEARRLAAEELEISRAYGAPRNLGIALRTAGLIAPEGEAIDLLREAVAVLEGSEARLEHARALKSLGAALARTGNRKDAREPLLQALDHAHRCGARVLAESARRALVAAGVRPRRLVLTGVDALTPSELRIARLAAQGLTNRQVAEQQFLTLRMVEAHLSRAYKKLGIGSRTELPAALASAAPSSPPA